MPSNTFLQPGTTTTLTLLYDRPKEGETRFGSYRAYRVRTPDGGEHTFLPPRSLFPELNRLNLVRGSCLAVRTSQRVSRDGRVFHQYELEASATPNPTAAPSTAPAGATAGRRPSPERSSMLACVALKAAAASHSSGGNAGDVLKIAELYQEWLEGRS